jgi:peptide deformylase
MILPVVSYGNAVLVKKAEDIASSYAGLPELIDNMFETMYAASGVGLAAPQVNLPLRLFVVDASPFHEDDPKADGFKKVFINAQIYERSENELLMDEGCLSFPGIREEVFRPESIRIRYLDENFIEHDEQYSGILARVIQHEYDHIEGILFVDHLSNLRKVLLKRRLKELSVGQVKVSYRMTFASPKRRNS